ncbi:uncharacterized protein LOC112348696 [Selaginella moellendorffii]|uniref:uncharacterized protein LOC112348696 n=1 Tax=Selaginella moellendorffii TaxID=88036 RepID=UPI000D1CEE82|nr:uncharacterized protein LOC112348696 [Selaginella moellendorffii]|eukprot:XP_024537490.1 uncharacterized protein LOC112348696 [Selaginella moellendorffii]
MLKVVAFPLRLGRRWAFQVLPSPIVQESGGIPAGSSTWDTVRELGDRIIATPRLSDRIDIFVRFAEDQMQRKWQDLAAARPGTIRSKIHRQGMKLLAKLEPSEQFFKAIPPDATKINIIHPSSLNSRLARRRLRHLAISGTAFHRRLLYGSLALLPFSSLFAIVPFPNVVILWNFFRVHAHWRALQGSRRLQALVTEEEKASQKKTNAWEFTPSEKLEKLVDRANSSSAEALSNEKIEAICKEFCLETTDVTKWRDHTSKMLKLAWV